MLVDSTILVDLVRGHKPALDAFESLLHGQSVSFISIYELIIGTHTKLELNKVFKLIKSLNLNKIPPDINICEKAEELLTKYRHSHGLGIQDALIASTALINNEELVTRERKHFQFIPNLKIVAPY